ncbi:MAG: Uma2 family endonuclease [Myxococcota bacterium]
MTARTAPRTPSVAYPESDGRPVGESGRHAYAYRDLIPTLEHRLRDRDDVYVGGNQFLYWVEGDPTQVVCPDVFVVVGRPRRPLRDTWRVWDEGGVVPTFVLELTSASTRIMDQGAKRGLYAALGVREYAMFDPRGEYLVPRLRLWRLADGDWVEVVSASFGAWSEVIGAFLVPDPADEPVVRLREADGTWVPRLVVQAARAEQALADAERAHTDAERARAEALQARAEALQARAEADALRAELEHLRRS